MLMLCLLLTLGLFASLLFNIAGANARAQLVADCQRLARFNADLSRACWLYENPRWKDRFEDECKARANAAGVALGTPEGRELASQILKEFHSLGQLEAGLNRVEA